MQQVLLVTAVVLSTIGLVALIGSLRELRNTRSTPAQDSPACMMNRGVETYYADGASATVPSFTDDQIATAPSEVLTETDGTPIFSGLDVPQFVPLPGLNGAQNRMMHMLSALSKACEDRSVPFWAWGDLLRAYVQNEGPFGSWPVLATRIELCALDVEKLDDVTWPPWIFYEKLSSGDRILRDVNSCYLDLEAQNEDGTPSHNGISLTLVGCSETPDAQRMRLSSGKEIPSSFLFELRETLLVGWSLPVPARPTACIPHLPKASMRMPWDRIDAWKRCAHHAKAPNLGEN